MTGTHDSDAVPILFIAGVGRCGSTLLDRMLGQHDGVFAAGEIDLIWEHALVEDGRCGCGDKLRTCTVWRSILEEAFGSMADVPIDDVLDRIHLARSRYTWMPHLGSQWARHLEKLEPYPTHVEAIYRAIPRVTGCEVIVDASKDPLYAEILESRTCLTITMLHMMRDPRATAHSWQRDKIDLGRSGATTMGTFGPAYTAVLWNVLNRAAARFGERHPERYGRLHYADFVADPSATLEQIARLIGHPLEPRLPIEDDRCHLAVTHSAWGNPNRFEARDVEIRADERWRRDIRPAHRAIASGLTVLSRRRFGYA